VAGLSPEALTAYAKLKGLTLTFYNQTKYEHDGDEKEYERVENPNPKIFLVASTVNFGPTSKGFPDGSYYYPDIKRNDPDLLKVVKDLGSEKASGSCAELAIVDIPDDISWTIEEYNGQEWVSENY
jgi:hypothetical protein